MRFFLPAFLLLMSTVSYAKNSFMVAPTRLVLDITRPQTKSLIVSNTGEDKIRVNISPTYLSLGDDGFKNGESLNPETSSSDDLSKYIRISPRTISLKPGEKRHVRISVRPPKGLTDGEYRAHVVFKMLEVSHTMKTESKKVNQVAMEIGFKLQTLIAVYGHVGQGVPNMIADCSVDTDGNLNVLAKNNASWRFDGKVSVADVEQNLFMIGQSKKNIAFQYKPTSKTFDINWIPSDKNIKLKKSICSLK